MMKRRTAPPSRPPPPKSGGSSGMSFSFKALEEGVDEDEDLTTCTRKFDKQVHEERERNQQAALDREKERSLSSKSLEGLGDTTIHKSPSVKSQNSLDKLLDIKDSIVKSAEEFLSDSFANSKDKENEAENALNGIEIVTIDDEESKPTEDFTNEPVEAEALDNDELEIDDGYYEDKDEAAGPFNGQIDEGDQMEITEEYFNPDGEDFSELPGVQPMLRQRKRLQKFRKIKPIVPPVPVSMSKLKESTAADIPDTSVQDENSNVDSDNTPAVQETQSESVITIHGTNIPKKAVAGLLVFLVYMIIPFPSYISGLIAGFVLSSGAWILYLWVIEHPKPRQPIPDDPALEELPPMEYPEIKEPKGEDGMYKGWMNEIVDYQPETYSINQTHSVFVHLEGTSLRMRRPKVNVPKRAMWDEPKNTNPQFVHQRHFDIEGSKVLLLPPGLVKKRLWSKKYPICVALAKAGRMHVKTDSAPQTPVTSTASSPAIKMTSSSSADQVHGFDVVTEEKCDTYMLYMFARTSHEKEQWYRRLVAATKGVPLKNHILEIKQIVESSNSSRPRRSSSSDSLRQRRQNSSDSLSSVTTTSSTVEDTATSNIRDLKDFIRYMSRLIPRDQNSSPSSPAHSLTGKDKDKASVDGKSSVSSTSSAPKTITCDPMLLPLNALLGRCFWDFLGDQYWADKVKDKLQKKLSKIHIPYFIEELQVSEINLGSETPVIRRANKPYLDENGFWLDLDLNYSGKFNMTIETKVNLLKLKTASKPNTSTSQTENKKSAVTDSEEEDSAESSTDEEDEQSNLTDDGSGQSGGTGKKIMKYINKIASSKYFQSAAENKYIKKAMTEVSNTRLILTVELQKLSGTLAINIPTPPSDRLWYGFRGNPQLWLVAKPKVGEREVTMSHITEWIEKKLAIEFQHVLVMPNMDDLVIPILSAGSDVEAFTSMSNDPEV